MGVNAQRRNRRRIDPATRPEVIGEPDTEAPFEFEISVKPENAEASVKQEEPAVFTEPAVPSEPEEPGEEEASAEPATPAEPDPDAHSGNGRAPFRCRSP